MRTLSHRRVGNAVVHHSKIGTPMSQMGHERQIGPVCNISASPPAADIRADIDLRRFVPGPDSCTAANHVRDCKSYSITSSEMESSVAGISMPIARAVAKLMTNSSLVERATGISAGFSPLRMRPT
jgi:hypothetical protein